MKKSSLPSSLLLIIVLCFSPALLLGSMAEEPQKQVSVVEEPQKQADVAEESQKEAGAVDEGAAAVHIVYVEQPPEGEVPEDYHVRMLASVLGSEDAAKEALVYSYSHAASGFSAKLTPKQVEEMSNKPGVLQVVPSRTLHLHSPTSHSSIGLGTVRHFGAV
ncbi:Tripeptidyl-peptidase II protein [Dioscorea alata]|uniref:Tripeptidyl-peptidase II protein n=1 Tax=Dioscorea alata TaxID=55571 RepID=A0ACB7WBX4_DIOAL|nr:Tripeptidyl-peptidase II protein [Dioscorea alata]